VEAEREHGSVLRAFSRRPPASLQRPAAAKARFARCRAA
jgi:hypothetical protein